MPKIGKNKMVNRQAVGTYQGKLHQRQSGAYGQGGVGKGQRAGASVAGGPAAASKINDTRCSGEVVDIDAIILDPHNARLHPERNTAAIKASLALYGQRKPVVVNRQTRVIVAGNGTWGAAKALGWSKIAASFSDFSETEAAGYGLADNKSAELARWDFEAVAKIDRLMKELGGSQMVGWTEQELTALRGMSFVDPNAPPPLNLSERFLVPPFSVLDARQGYWQTRKKQWFALGIQSELGRGEVPNGLLGFSEQARAHYAVPGGSPLEAASLGEDGRTLRGDGRGRPLVRTFASGNPGDLAMVIKTADGYRSLKELQQTDATGTAQPLYGAYWSGASDDTSRRIAAVQPQSGTSIFDPVLCELAYRWFSPPDGQILDPFAGGSVRGIVAAKLGRAYAGIDLRPEQAAANESQAARIVPDNRPVWVCGDALDAESLLPGAYDLIFSCPPYADLERYSDDPRDLSTMPYEQFLEVYGAIIAASCRMLADDRFACFVCGDVRDKATGAYRGFIGDTVAAFRAAGLAFYNEAVLVTAVGSLPIRVGRQFSKYRKLGKTHQNVLVFVKGDPGRAVEACGPVEMGDLEELLKQPVEGLGVDDAS